MAFFPDPQKQGDIKFFLAKSLPYGIRMAIIIVLMIIGVLIQALINFWIGLILIVCGTVLSLIKGYEPVPKIKSGTEKWNQVTPDEYKKIKLKEEQIEKWDTDSFDITNSRGKAVFIIIIIPLLSLIFFSPPLIWLFGSIYIYLCIDIAAVLIPHWVTGIRNYLKKDKLIIKINILEKVMELFLAPSDVQVLPMLATEETIEKKRVPSDARLMIKFLNSPAYFLGVQVQLSINNVQGTDYPYLYCVVLSKQEEKLFAKKEKTISSIINSRKNIISEVQKAQDGVDVLVIRQFTTKTSGYHTNITACYEIASTAVDLARELIK